ncbi:MAG: cytochrome P450 [Acidimicrobiia bacterium]
MARTAERDIDSLDGHFYDDPWETYAWLRRNAPIYWDAKNELWVISRHEDVSHVSRTPELWCSKHGVRPVAVDMSLISKDEPEHTRLRRLINRGFTPRMVGRIKDHVHELARGIVADIAPRGECDFVADFAIHVPLIVIAELMGLDPDQRSRFYKWSDDMMAGDNHLESDDPKLVAATDAFVEYVAYVQTLIDERKINPREDLISILTGAYTEGVLAAAGEHQNLQDDELLMFLVLLVVAGNETTRNAISGGMLALSEFPEERASLLADLDDPEVVNRAVEEMLRYVSPVMSFLRTVTEDLEYQGVKMREGQRVLLLYQSANRDERVFEAPDVLALDRDPNPHLAFGIGPHFCLGANLARMEIRVVFEELLRRLPDIRVRPGYTLKRSPSSLVLAISELPAVFSVPAEVA